MGDRYNWEYSEKSKAEEMVRTTIAITRHNKLSAISEEKKEQSLLKYIGETGECC